MVRETDTRPEEAETEISFEDRIALGQALRDADVTLRALFTDGRAWPDGVDEKTLRGWLSGKIRTARPAVFETVLAILRSQGPDQTHKNSPRSAKSITKAPAAPSKFVALDEMTRAELHALRALSRVSARKIARELAESDFALTADTIWRWMRGDTRRVRREFLDAVITCWRTHADRRQQEDLKRRNKQKQLVEITEDMRAELRMLQASTGVGPQRLLKEIGPPLASLNPALVYQWMNGETKRVDPARFDAVLSAWRSRKPITRLSEEQRAEIRVLRHTIGLTFDAAHGAFSPPIAKLSRNFFGRLITGPLPLVDSGLVDEVITRLRARARSRRTEAARAPGHYVILNEALRTELSELMRAAGISCAELAKECRFDGLKISGPAIEQWVLGNQGRVRQERVEFVLRVAREMTDRENSLRLRMERKGLSVITAEMRAMLQEAIKDEFKHKGRTGRSDLTNPGLGLTRVRLNGVLSGRLKALPHRQVEFLIDACEAIRARTVSTVASRGWRVLDARQRERLSRVMKKAGKARLHAAASSALRPIGVTMRTLSFYRSGRAAVMRDDHLQFVLQFFEVKPLDRIEIAESRKGTLWFDASMARQLARLIQRAKLTPAKIVRGAKDAPDGLNADVIHNWITGSIETADPAHIDFVIQRLSESVK